MNRRHTLYSIALTLLYVLSKDIIAVWIIAIALAYAEPET